MNASKLRLVSQPVLPRARDTGLPQLSDTDMTALRLLEDCEPGSESDKAFQDIPEEITARLHAAGVLSSLKKGEAFITDFGQYLLACGTRLKLIVQHNGLYIDCPKCNERLGDLGSDPRGMGGLTCDSCNETFNVPERLPVVLE